MTEQFDLIPRDAMQGVDVAFDTDLHDHSPLVRREDPVPLGLQQVRYWGGADISGAEDRTPMSRSDP